MNEDERFVFERVGKLYVGTTQVASLLSVTEATVLSWWRTHRLPKASHVESRHKVRWRLCAITDWMAQNKHLVLYYEGRANGGKRDRGRPYPPALNHRKDPEIQASEKFEE